MLPPPYKHSHLPFFRHSSRRLHHHVPLLLHSALTPRPFFQLAFSVLADAHMGGGRGEAAAWALQNMLPGAGRELRMMNAVVAGEGGCNV